MLIISIFTAFTGVHDSEREHFGVLKAFEGVLRSVLGDTDRGLKAHQIRYMLVYWFNFLSVHSIINHNLFPKVAMVFDELLVYGVVLVSGLPFKIRKKHHF